ncbi:MAG: metal-dependent transcriptional regulator [Elusimicrobia bacterium]|nr:metal-dependent transcriptional regulator [Elusimicrobiota bacterium]
MPKLTKSLEDYIEAVFMIEKKEGIVSVSKVANFLNVKKPSAHTALNILKKRGLLNYKKYGKISLTEKGKNISKNITDYHFMLTELLCEIIGIDRQCAFNQACVLEHEIDANSYRRISDFVRFVKKEKEFLKKYKGKSR